jgi:hypothetical protein
MVICRERFAIAHQRDKFSPFLLLYTALKRDNCVENDRCSNATAVDRLPIVISASTSLASVAGYNSPATVCNTVNGDAKAVWYELIGDGSCVSASIVGEGFDAILSLYEGDNCGSLTCLAQSNIGNGSSGRGLLSWRTENGSTYKILVAGAYGLQAGDYVLGITVRAEWLHDIMHFPWFTYPQQLTCRRFVYNRTRMSAPRLPRTTNAKLLSTLPPFRSPIQEV